MIPFSPIAKQSTELCHNKRKNFHPRCLSEDEESDKETNSSNSLSFHLNSQSNCKLTIDTETIPLTSSSPIMADSIFNEFISNLNGQAMATNGKLDHQQQALDLTNPEEQLQQQKQLAELLFLKNIRNFSMFYPHLSPQMFMQSTDSKLPIDVTSDPANETKDGSVESVPEPEPVHQEPIESEPVESTETAESSPIEQLLHLYGINRDLYMKALQQANRSSQESSESMELGSLSRKLII